MELRRHASFKVLTKGQKCLDKREELLPQAEACSVSTLKNGVYLPLPCCGSELGPRHESPVR